MEIRPARPADSRMVVPLIMQASEDIASVLAGAREHSRVVAQLTHFFQQPNNRMSYQNILVAEVSEQVAGMVIFYYGADTPRLDQPIATYLRQQGQENVLEKEADDDEWYIDSLAVAPRYGGRGIGSALIGAVERKVLHVGHHKLALVVNEENQRAQRLYLRLGFRQDRIVHLYQHPYLHMVKYL
jgi:Acetyltransferases